MAVHHLTVSELCFYVYFTSNIDFWNWKLSEYSIYEHGLCLWAPYRAPLEVWIQIKALVAVPFKKVGHDGCLKLGLGQWGGVGFCRLMALHCSEAKGAYHVGMLRVVI